MARRLPKTVLDGRLRTSTVLLSGLFVAVLALYLVVRPPPAPAPGRPASPVGTTTERRTDTTPPATTPTDTTPPPGTDGGQTPTTGTTPGSRTDTDRTNTTDTTSGNDHAPTPTTPTGGAGTDTARSP